MTTLEDILYDRYARYVQACKRAGMPYPTWQEYLEDLEHRLCLSDEWSTDND